VRLGFYLHGQQPVDRVLPLIARAAMGQGQRLLVVSGDDDQLARLSTALWEQYPAEFLAHGFAGGPHDARQPILLADRCTPANEAGVVALADGIWREDAAAFPRALLFFDEAGRKAARETWRLFDGRDGVEREFHELEGGRWIHKA
jgi:DNA polymerase III subunit chi